MGLNTQIPDLYLLSDDNKGRAVFTSHPIPNGSIIESCPVIILDQADTVKIHDTQLHDYYFVWDLDDNQSAIALGFGSLYNHSENSNAEFIIDRENNMINFLATRDIGAHEEICVHYIHPGNHEHELWFSPDA